MKKILIYSILAAVCCSCFTGIESTPKVTDDQVRRSGVRVTPEQTFAASLTAEAPSAWKPDKRWKVTDNKIALIFAGSPVGADSLAGSIISLKATRPARTVLGGDVMEIVFQGPDGQPLTYRTDVAADDWGKRTSLGVPFTVELSAVATADSLMRGKTYYITTPLWYDAHGKSVQGLRHIPVKVDSVIPGTANYPLCVAFTPQQGNATPRYILMTYGTGTAASRNFDRLFSFENPRKSYPRITDDTWALITRSQIREGMTRDEARLALGAPASVDRGFTEGGSPLERWSYDNGIYLLFEEGILIRFRK